MNTMQQNRIRWVWLGLTFGIVVGLSVGLAYLLRRLIPGLGLPASQLAWATYLLIFAVSLVVNLSIIVPVPLAASFMVAVATAFNPVLVALFGSIGGAIGELSGYYAGYLGKKVAIPETIGVYQMVERWIRRYGVWAIFFLSIQPVIPFDIGGFVAGVARMRVRSFLLASWLGKFPKYLVLTLAGAGLIHYLPQWLQ